jgi:hypothetical protein
MKKYFITLFFLSLFSGNLLLAQDYKTGIGLRCGWLGGLTVKHFISDGTALEGILSSGWGYHGYQFTGLYEKHKAAFTKDDAKGFFWYYGGGAHFAWGYKYKVWINTSNGQVLSGYWDDHRYSAFGVDGIFGLEYKVEDVPVTFSVDIKPFIEFSNYNNYPFHFWDGAFTIRFIIDKQEDKKEKK